MHISFLIVPSHFFSFFFFNDTATTEIYTLSLHDALPIFLSGGVIGVLGFLGYWLSYVLNEGLSAGLSYGLNEGLSKGLFDALSVVWLFAIGGGLFGWAVSGGWAVLRHCVLRWLLHRRQVFPWHAQVFLNDATARILLRRVGGGYSFIHRLWLGNFAHLDEWYVEVQTRPDTF